MIDFDNPPTPPLTPEEKAEARMWVRSDKEILEKYAHRYIKGLQSIAWGTIMGVMGVLATVIALACNAAYIAAACFAVGFFFVISALDTVRVFKYGKTRWWWFAVQERAYEILGWEPPDERA